MKYGISVPPFGDYSDPRTLARMAQEAEQAGWDGFFLWDHMVMGDERVADPWIALAAIALNTSHIALGPMVISLARRRPWKVAREAVTLDHLSQGRLLLGFGLGGSGEDDFGRFGEAADDRIRAQKLDEGLTILDGLWSGQPFSFHGEHYHLNDVTFRPTPLRQPRIPIWIGGSWDKPRPQKRAARWDGYSPLKWLENMSVEEWKQVMEAVNRQRPQPDAPFDWIHNGQLPGDDPGRAAEIARPYAELGVTWWIEDAAPYRWGWRFDQPLTEQATRLMDDRIRQGPPLKR